MGGRDLVDTLHAYTHAYPGRGYGGFYHRWASASAREPYNSFGNGAAMRVSPVGFALETIEDVLTWSKRSAEVTHNHLEGIKGAQATAAAIYLARTTRDKSQIRKAVESRFGYDLSASLDEIRPTYRFNETCQETVPQAIVAFLESTSYEDAIRNAISLGGDADTLACIAGGIAEAHYGSVPKELAEPVLGLLDERLTAIVNRFQERFCVA
jgi:ADP-ribosylglycohydrolase